MKQSDFRLAALVLALLSLLALCTNAAFGQAEAGTISGTVRDASGAVLTGAKVTVTNVATSVSRTAQSGNLGQYSIPGLTPGSYEVIVTSQNFQTFKSRVEVTVGGVSTVDAQLTVGASSTVVEVTAGGGGTQVNTETQEVSQLIDSQQLSTLPSLTRNPYDFIAISGNVSGGDSTTPNTMGSQNLTGRGVGYAINGQRESGTEILLDGQENVDLFGANVGQQIPIDSVQEYRVITNNFDTEYGRASGGVVNLTTKSGTNALHGSAWEYNRTAWSTANTYANDAHNAAFLAGGGTGPLPDPKGGYTRNQFGFIVGGPIIKNKLFFSASTEFTRVRSNSLQTQEVLDPAFIALMPTNIQNYFNAFGSGAPAASGTVTAGALRAAGITTIGPVNGVTPIPDSTNVFDVVNFHVPFDAGGGFPQNTYTFAGRVDFNMTDKTQMFFRFARDYEEDALGTTSYSAYSQYNVGSTTNDDSFLYSLNHSFSASIFSNTKLAFSRFNVFDAYKTALTSVPNLMLGGFVVDPTNGIPVQLPGLENVAPGLGGLPFGGPQDTTQLQQDLSWIKGKHDMRFGGQFTYIQLNKTYGAYAQAVEELGSGLGQGLANMTNISNNPGGSGLISFVSRVNANGVFPCHTDPWGNIVLTPSCEVTPPLGKADYSRSYRYRDWAVYAQDSFKLTPRLTLNYGMRYEHYGVQHNLNPNEDSNFYLGSGANLYDRVRSGQMFIADKSPVGQFWEPSWGTAAPRVGFAYDVFGDGKTSLRGGFGISYERNFGNVTFNASFNPPASAVLNSICAPNADTSVGGPGNPCTVLATNNGAGPLSLPGPAAPLPPTELRAPQSNIRTAQTQFWSLGVQREIARNTVVEIGYNAAHGVHLYDIENINLVGSGNVYLGDATAPTATNSCAFSSAGTENVCLTRANNQFSNINMRGSLGTSSYNALNVKFQTSNLHRTGLGLVANYTWAHSLDDLSSTFSDNLQGGSGAIGSLGYLNVVTPKLDWGSSDYDIRNRFVVSPTWQTPWFKSGKGFMAQALGGWTVSGIATIRSGIPFTVFDYTNDFNFYTVPRLTPATPITSYHVNGGTAVGPNLFNVLAVPTPASAAPLNAALGISDFGPYPADMTHRNAFRGPGAWGTDLGVSKSFKVTERVGLQFTAEGFDIFNHHNLYVNTSNLAYGLSAPGTMLTGSNDVTALKGGLGSTALGGNHDERRFGQFALRISF